MMLFRILGILLIVYLSGKTDMFGRKGDSTRKGADDALGILEKRYAEGSLSREDFFRMKEEIAH
ncbi:MAG: hypothetical protein PHN93_05565 [Sphaerochaetaceae bacterium]|nr:hypothetical protein [Sphaerochaetaceae bacterium]